MPRSAASPENLWAIMLFWFLRIRSIHRTAISTPHDIESGASRQPDDSGTPTQHQQSSSSMNQGEEGQPFRLAAKIFIPVQIAGIVALIPICFVDKLPADWLAFPLILVLFLLTLSFLLSTYLLFKSTLMGRGTNEASQNHVIKISVVLMVLALVISVGTCVAHLVIIHRPNVHGSSHYHGAMKCHVHDSSHHRPATNCHEVTRG
ncbi:uncharacterized protein LOC126410325 [Nymphaea colorata]|nr:uncharacterized protein LOC126410325 [Nymphaea colorata]